MTDEQGTRRGGIRRVSRKDRKNRLESSGLVFPPDTPLPEADSALQAGDHPPAESVPPEPPLPARPASAADERYPPLDPRPQKPPRAPAPPRRRTFWYNVGTVFFMLAACGLLGYYTLIALDPYTPLNPLPPFTPLPIIVTTTPLPPTATIPPTPTITPTAPPTHTFTPLPAELLPTRPTFTPAPFPFTISNEGVTYTRNRTPEGCDWLSIAGSVSGLGGEILNGYGVQITGEGLEETVFTGGAESLFFSAGEFELRLGDTPAVAPYIVRLYSPEGAALSDEYLVVTSSECSQNVAVINFVQNRPVD
jgi:hypothetical protein